MFCNFKLPKVFLPDLSGYNLNCQQNIQVMVSKMELITHYRIKSQIDIKINTFFFKDKTL